MYLVLVSIGTPEVSQAIKDLLEIVLPSVPVEVVPPDELATREGDSERPSLVIASLDDGSFAPARSFTARSVDSKLGMVTREFSPLARARVDDAAFILHLPVDNRSIFTNVVMDALGLGLPS